jgi:diguanylate cyclase (GGDEF)-like protein
VAALVGLRSSIATALLVVGLLPLALGVGLVVLLSRLWVPALPDGPPAAAVYGALAVCVLVVVALASVVSRRLVRPIRALQEGARRLGEGDLDHRLAIPVQEELAQVAGAFNAMAGRLAESYRTLEQTVADRTMALTALHTVAVTANRTLDPDEIMASVLDRVPVVLNLEGGFIRLAEERGLVLRAHRGVPPRFVEVSAVCAIGEGLSGRVAQGGAPLVSDGVAGTGEAVLFEEGFRAAACVPVTAKGHVLGTLAVASRYPRTFTAQDLQLLTSIGSQLGTALENAGLYERACAMVEEFQHLDRFKTEFLSNVSHELRIPLTSVIGFAELLLEHIPGELNPEQEKYVRTMLSSGRDLLEMINNLLDLSKIKAGKIDWRPASFDLWPLIEVVEHTIRPLLVKKHLHLGVEVADAPAIVLADEGRVKQVLLNLLSNAIKFTPPGGTIGLRVCQVEGVTGPAVEVRVEDTGIGIASEDLDRIFNEFHQVDGTPTRDHPGTGLGLAITKRLVELQGGTISVESRLREGSRFTVLLPQGAVPEAVPPARPASVMQSVMESLVASAAARAQDARKMPKIAVAAPDPGVRLALGHSLESADYEAHLIEPGDLLAAQLRVLRPFAVILDVGAGAWSTLRELRVLQDVHPILLGTADDGLHACAFAPVGWAATPIAPDDLRSALRRAGVLRAGRRRPATVLVAADRATVEAVRSALRQDGVGVIEADATDPVARVGELQPDLILLDLLKTAAFDAARRLAQHPVARAIPIVALVPDAVGEMDWVRLTRQARQVAASGELLQDEAVSACRTLERLLPERAGLIDHGTRLYTERYLRHCLAEAVERAWGLHRPFSLLVFEADTLPADAKRGGSPTTERLLRELADLLRRHTRATNPICRLGAAVFALVLADISTEGARFIGEKLRALVADTPFQGRDAGRGGRLTVSGGVAAFFADAETADELVTAALGALSRARLAGGNRVEGPERETREAKGDGHALAADDRP